MHTMQDVESLAEVCIAPVNVYRLSRDVEVVLYTGLLLGIDASAR